MRHFGSLLVAAVFAPAIFLLTGTGLSAFTSALDDNKAVDPLGALAAFGALLLAGVLYGILVMARLSPLGPGLAGMAGLVMSGWAMFDISSYQAAFARVDVHMGGSVGDLGLGILLGVPLLATLTSARRWRKEELPRHMVRYQPAPQYPPPPQHSPTPGYRPAPDPTRQLPAQPEYQPLPDIAPPSLRYPAVTPTVVPPHEAPPLPKRVPAPPPDEQTVKLTPGNHERDRDDAGPNQGADKGDSDDEPTKPLQPPGSGSASDQG